MQRIRPVINIKLFACLSAWVLLMACTKGITDEEMPAPVIPPKGSLEKVSVVIGAANISETKAYHGDEYAQAGEFIHSLHLLIVNENKEIERHIYFDGTGNEEAAKGNLAQYSTTIESLPPGKKTFYAFANMEKAQVKEKSSTLDTLLKGDDFKEGKTLPDELSTYVIENPKNGLYDGIKNQTAFIPMSVKQEVNVSVDGQRITISLVRLVAKVKMQLANNRGKDAVITKLEMKSFANEVALFKGAAVTAAPVASSISVDINPAVTVANNTVSEIVEFYVNETTGTNPFEVTLTINGEKFTGVLKTTSLVRNQVLPVSLHLLNSTLQLTVKASVAPIGGYPTLVNLGNNTLTNNYLFKLPEGCYFSVEGEFLTHDDLGTITKREAVTKWNWSVSDLDASKSFITIESVQGAATFEAHLTSMPEKKIELLFDVLEPQQINNASLTIMTVPLQDWDTTYPSAALNWEKKPVWYEAVSLTRKK